MEKMGDRNLENGKQSLLDLKPFYVYALMSERTQEVFYIGKGQDVRLRQHVKERNGQTETDKERKIAEIEGSNDSVKAIVIGRFDSEKEAFAVECALIHWVYGIHNLTNIASGHGVKCMRNMGCLGDNFLPEKDPRKPFYAYVLTDPEDNSIFYVGKGTGNRCRQHQKEVENGFTETRKQRKIHEILKGGRNLKPVIIGYFETEREALAVESVLIHWVYGIDSLTNDTSGHGVVSIRPKGHYQVLQGIDEPELSYSERQRENRERNNVIKFLNELRDLIERECDIRFDGINTSHPKHTYLEKIIKGVRLTVVCHHNPKISAAVTIESLNLKECNRKRVRYICEKTILEWRDNGRYGRILPAGTYRDPRTILDKFEQTLSEVEKVEI